MILVLLGPPGAGKGTQAGLLAREFGVPHVSTGEIFREHLTRGTELGKKVRAIMDAGGLVADDIANALVQDRFSRPDVRAGFILDGYPRTTAQAEYLDKLLQSMGQRIDRVLSYDVPEEVLVERLSGRRSCPTCGAVYHVSRSPSKRAGFCDREGAGLVQRPDDRPESVRKRLEEYEAKTEPLKRYYQARSLLTEIEGVGSLEGILAATKRKLSPTG